MSDQSVRSVLEFYRYRIPFREPFRMRKRAYEHREGIILYSHWQNQHLFGEAAPLYGFSTESIEKVAQEIRSNAQKLQDIWQSADSYDDWLNQLEPLQLSPSLRFGLDTIFLDRASRVKDQPLHTYIYEDSGRSISLNGILGQGPVDTTLSKAGSLVREGFSTLKLKVGRHHDRETEILRKLTSQFPDVNLRVDANQAWGFSEAKEILNSWQDLNIEYCEEPLMDATIRSYQELSNLSTIPLAWDESIDSIEHGVRILKAKAADVIILKPMRFGCFKEIKSLIDQAKKSNCKVVITTLLESGVGRRATAHLAAAYLSDSTTAQGLATGNLLADDLASDYHLLSKGRLNLPKEPGLGLDITSWPPQSTNFEITKLN